MLCLNEMQSVKKLMKQVKTDLATLNADIEIVKANIALTELRAPFDGIIGLRQISVGSYASPTTIVAKLTKDYSAESRIFSTGTLCKPD